VFPRPAFALRWRLKLFELLCDLHRIRPIGVSRHDFSLLEAAPVDGTTA
jgi:hypothetical protein